MPYGFLSADMTQVLKSLVEGKIVWDLGAGDQGYAKLLLRLGALKVVCVDKSPMRSLSNTTLIQAPFWGVKAPEGGIQVSFLSWPRNSPLPGLVTLLEASRRVVYLGSNVGGNCCGNKELFLYLRGRKLVEHHPTLRNTFSVYGKTLTEEREATGDEWAAITGRLTSFAEAENTVSVYVQ